MELKDLKVGDVVAEFIQCSNRTKLSHVERTTKSLIITNRFRYRKSDGRSISDSIWHNYIYIPTKEEVQRITIENKKSFMKNVIIGFAEFVKRDNVSFGKIEKVYDLIVSFDK